MQNRFKFRVWNKKLNCMCFADAGTNYFYMFQEDSLIVMQCTGLKDSYGKLIYEGDIVEVQYIGSQIPLFKNKYSFAPETERFEIFCHSEWLKFYAKNDNYRKTCEIHSLDLEKIRINEYNKKYRIIGNIYENADLLESEGENE